MGRVCDKGFARCYQPLTCRAALLKKITFAKIGSQKPTAQSLTFDNTYYTRPARVHIQTHYHAQEMRAYLTASVTVRLECTRAFVCLGRGIGSAHDLLVSVAS